MDKSKLLERTELKTKQSKIFGVEGVQVVTIRELTLAERLEMEDRALEEGSSHSAALVVAAVIDEGGNRVFDWEDAKTINELQSSRFEEVIRDARDLCLVGPKAEVIAENFSEGAQIAGSNG